MPLRLTTTGLLLYLATFDHLSRIPNYVICNSNIPELSSCKSQEILVILSPDLLLFLIIYGTVFSIQHFQYTYLIFFCVCINYCTGYWLQLATS